MNILVLNAGSSSLKSSLFRVSDTDPLKLDSQPRWQAEIEWDSADNIESEIQNLLISLWTGDKAPISAPAEINLVGHRVVHGGSKYTNSTLITEQVLSDLHNLIQLAPTHEPINIQGIEIAKKVFKDIPQVAVFDTAFHSGMPRTAFIYPVPYEWYEKLGIRRFGFHGISHQSCAKRSADLLERDLKSLRIITCHLGGGASLCAIKDGASQMTTMGYTPLEGLVMGTRSGSIDPGLILYLLNKEIYSASEIDKALNKESGLKGISGITADMKEIQCLTRAGNERAKLSFDIYINHLTSQIASLIPTLGGLDVLAFTGGVGQNSSIVRAAACEQLKFAGVNIDLDKNNSCTGDMDISDAQSAVKTLVIQAKEQLAIAGECMQFVGAGT